ncbi:MAG TPA: ATP-binding protein [Bacteroidales bacterium]|nr:ATP-binding protein [Bacteroidales bacterium]
MKNYIEHQHSILSFLGDSIPDIILYKDIQGIYIGCNSNFAELMGLSKEEIIGKTDYDLLEKEKADYYTLNDQKVIESHSSIQYEEWVTYPSGKKALIDTRKTPFYDDFGNIIGVIGVGRDITEWDRIKKELIVEKQKAEAANLIKSEFLANMSHEIRTPLNAILGFSEALFQQLHDPEEKKMVQYILNSGSLLMGLLNDILDLSKIESGQLKISPQALELRSILKETYVIYNTITNQKKIQFTIETDPNFPKIVFLDEIRMKQVLLNLVGNAVKFTEKGEIKVFSHFKETGENLGTVKISIIDTGIGIHKKHLKEIFESFKQTNSVTSKFNKGVGLGLAISKRLIEKMKGKITVNSELGKGSTFCITIPNVPFLNSNIDHNDLEIFPDEQVQKNQKGTILVVDDVFLNTELISRLLKPIGIEVFTAENGEKAIQMLETFTPDLILLDMRMPGLSGYEVAKIIKNNNHSCKIPIIAFTASVFSSDKIMKTGDFDGYLFKPIKRTDLLNTLQKHLPYHKLKQMIQQNVSQNSELIPSVPPLEESTTESRELTHKMIWEELLQEWDEIHDTLVIFKIEAFAQKIRSIAQKNKYSSMIHYADTLLDSIDQLDIDSIKEQISQFPKFSTDLINHKGN